MDTERPYVTAIGKPGAGTYGLGRAIDFTVTFSEPVVVDTGGGVPWLRLRLDSSSSSYAELIAGSGTDTLAFRKVVAAGDQSVLRTTLVSLDPHGGTIRDVAGNAADTDLTTIPGYIMSDGYDVTGVTVDGIVPRLDLQLTNFLFAQPYHVAVRGFTEPGSSVTVSEGGTVLASLGIQAGTGGFGYVAGGLPDGFHTLVFTAVDRGGNQNSTSISFTLDTTPPTLAFRAGAITSSHLLQAIGGTIDAADAGLAVTLSVGGRVLASGGTDAAGSFTFSPVLSVGGIVDAAGHFRSNAFASVAGSDVLHAAATDAAGNVGSADVRFTLDFAPNKGLFGSTALDPGSPGGQVYALYDGLLHRLADEGGRVGFTSQLAAGTSLADVTAGILSSPEYASHHGPVASQTDATFVDGLYTVVLGRHADAEGLAGWTQQLSSGASRGAVAAQIVLSAEHLARLHDVFVPDDATSEAVRLYYTVLDRAPDAAGLAADAAALRAGRSLEQVAGEFLGSAEYGAQFATLSNAAYVDLLYQNGLGRHPAAVELTVWENSLSHGTSRAAVAAAVAASPEAHLNLAPAIEQGWILL